ncbi:MAG: T9SS type A sorting domain-containing protein [Bacteroidota bacterium]
MDEANAIVPVPGGLAEASVEAFDNAVRAAVTAYSLESADALRDARDSAGPVSTLQSNEFAALGIEVIFDDEPGANRHADVAALASRRDIGSRIEACDEDTRQYLTRNGEKTDCPPVAGPYDPNEKAAADDLRCEYGRVTIDGEETFRCVRTFLPLAQAADPLTFTVRFENLAEATAPAEFVTITDVLDPALDPQTLEVLSTSDDSTFSVTIEGQTATFRFNGIDLPPNVNPPEGEGYVTFQVAPRLPLQTGDTVENEASIVFDFNPPIVTNTVVYEARQASDLATFVDAPDFVEEGQPFTFEVRVFNLVGDPVAESTLSISTGGAPVASATPSVGSCIIGATVECDLGEVVEDEPASVTVMLDSPQRGIYTLTSTIASGGFDPFTPNNTDAVSSGVVGVSVEDDSAFPREVRLASIAPNPARDLTTLRWGVPLAAPVDLRVYDLRGREVAVLASGEQTQAGWHETTWRPEVASGVYVVRLVAGEEVRTRKLVVIR